MEEVNVKKELYESNSISTTWSPGDCKGPVNNAANDPRDVLSSEKELYCDTIIKSEEIHLPDCIINPEEMQPFDLFIDPEEFQLCDWTINPEEVNLSDCTVNPEEMQPLDCTINQDKRQLLLCSINPGEMQPLDCTTNPKVIQLQNRQIKQEKNQLYDTKLKSEYNLVPHIKAVEQVNIQPYKIIIKPEKSDVIEISDDSNDSDCTLPVESLESQEQTQPGIDNVNSSKAPESSVEDDSTFSPAKMKIIPGKLAVCDNCGFLSMDFNRCFRCRRKLPLDCKVVDAEDAVTQVLDKSKMKIEIADPQFSVKDIVPAAVQEPLLITAPLRKTRVNSKQHKPATVRHLPGKLAVCPFCGCFSGNIRRCSKSRCRRTLPKDCLVIDAPESPRKKLLPEVKENIVLESEKPEADPEPSSNPPYRCNECPFVSSCRKSYLYHKQFHRSRGDLVTVVKCPQCTYNVSHDRLLKQHIKLHDKGGRSAPVTVGVEEAVSTKEQRRSKRSSRNSIVSYAEADSTDDEVDPEISETRNEAVTPCRDELVTSSRNEDGRKDDPNEWEFVLTNLERQEDDGKKVSSDEVLFCYECELSWKGNCPIHGAFVAVEDIDVPIDVENDVFAIRTAPSLVRIGNSEIPGMANGIFARETLPSRLRFGPLKGKLGPLDSINSYTWLIRKDGKPFLCVDLSEPGTSCWLRYLRIAKNVAEMNCAAHQYQGRLYVTTIRWISPQEELLVGPYDHNGLLVKYDPDRVKSPKVSSWVSRSLKRKSEERRESSRESPIGSKINTLRFSPVPTLPTSVQKGKRKISLRCHICFTTCRDRASLDAHLRMHGEAKPYVCSECGWRSRSKTALSLHMKRRHSNPARAKPTASSPVSSLSEKRTTDVSGHVGKQSFVCNVCNEAFRYSIALKKHRCAPVKGKPFKCSECSLRYVRKKDLKVHYRLHTGEKPFVCSVCKEAFLSSYALKKHREIHCRVDVVEKPFKCTVCSAQFSEKSHLGVHLRVHTTKGKTYMCNVCDEPFEHELHSKRYSIMRAGEKNRDSSESSGRLSRKDDLIAHSRVHTFACVHSVCALSRLRRKLI